MPFAGLNPSPVRYILELVPYCLRYLLAASRMVLEDFIGLSGAEIMNLTTTTNYEHSSSFTYNKIVQLGRIEKERQINENLVIIFLLVLFHYNVELPFYTFGI